MAGCEKTLSAFCASATSALETIMRRVLNHGICGPGHREPIPPPCTNALMPWASSAHSMTASSDSDCGYAIAIRLIIPNFRHELRPKGAAHWVVDCWVVVGVIVTALDCPACCPGFGFSPGRSPGTRVQGFHHLLHVFRQALERFSGNGWGNPETGLGDAAGDCGQGVGVPAQ